MELSPTSAGMVGGRHARITLLDSHSPLAGSPVGPVPVVSRRGRAPRAVPPELRGHESRALAAGPFRSHTAPRGDRGAQLPPLGDARRMGLPSALSAPSSQQLACQLPHPPPPPPPPPPVLVPPSAQPVHAASSPLAHELRHDASRALQSANAVPPLTLVAAKPARTGIAAARLALAELGIPTSRIPVPSARALGSAAGGGPPRYRQSCPPIPPIEAPLPSPSPRSPQRSPLKRTRADRTPSTVGDAADWAQPALPTGGAGAAEARAHGAEAVLDEPAPGRDAHLAPPPRGGLRRDGTAQHGGATRSPPPPLGSRARASRRLTGGTVVPTASGAAAGVAAGAGAEAAPAGAGAGRGSGKAPPRKLFRRTRRSVDPAEPGAGGPGVGVAHTAARHEREGDASVELGAARRARPTLGLDPAAPVNAPVAGRQPRAGGAVGAAGPRARRALPARVAPVEAPEPVAAAAGASSVPSAAEVEAVFRLEPPSPSGPFEDDADADDTPQIGEPLLAPAEADAHAAAADARAAATATARPEVIAAPAAADERLFSPPVIPLSARRPLGAAEAPSAADESRWPLAPPPAAAAATAGATKQPRAAARRPGRVKRSVGAGASAARAGPEHQTAKADAIITGRLGVPIADAAARAAQNAAASAEPSSTGGSAQQSGGGGAISIKFDPVLNCYYEPTTGRYYELR